MRKYYLDWLRVIIVLILIPFHSAVSFSHIGNAYIYTEEASTNFLFLFISDYFNLWFMRMLFFIAGISIYYGLQKRTTVEFIQERGRRLILPVLFLILTIGPLSGYILGRTKYGFTGNFIEFYPQFFLNIEQYLFWAHMWFCVYLYTFSILALPLFKHLIKKENLLAGLTNWLSSGNRLYLPMIIIVIFEGVFRPYYPGLQSLIGDWANFTVHLSFVIFGFVFANSDKLMVRIQEKRNLSLAIGLLSTLTYLYIKRFSYLDSSLYIVKVSLSLLWGIAAYSWIMFYIGFAASRLNIKNRALNYLGKSSFSFYIFHYFIITLVSLFILGLPIHNIFKWLIITLISFGILFSLFELVIKRSKVLSYICGIK